MSQLALSIGTGATISGGRGSFLRNMVAILSLAGCITPTPSVQRTLRAMESSLTWFIWLTIDSAAILQNLKGANRTERGRNRSMSFSPLTLLLGVGGLEWRPAGRCAGDQHDILCGRSRPPWEPHTRQPQRQDGIDDSTGGRIRLRCLGLWMPLRASVGKDA